MPQKDYETFIKNGITYLHSSQEKDGSYLSFSSPTALHFRKQFTYHTTFINSLILLTLHSLQSTPTLTIIKKQLASFLLSQKSTHWSWNYWIRDSQEAKMFPYPDDLDDTFCALTALYQYNPKLISGDVMASIVQMLVTTEQKEGGPYKTWLITNDTNKKWSDIDIAVNCNIAYFLSLNEITLPKVSKFINSVVKKGQFISPYYVSPYSTIYFLSRFYKSTYKNILLTKLLSLRKKDYSWGNPLDTALAISSLLNLGIMPQQLRNSISYLTKKPEQLFQAYPFCMDPTRNKKKYYAGSPALTTAFALEAITKYAIATQNYERECVFMQVNLYEKKLSKEILLTFRKRFINFDTKWKVQIRTITKELLKKDPEKHILLLPYYFTSSLGKKKDLIPYELLIKLGVANLFGWIAYTIYDNFLDNEGEPPLLPFANVALREVTSIFVEVLPHSDFYLFSKKIMDQIEQANFWEMTNCRVPITDTVYLTSNQIPNFLNHRQLAQKSLGHALGPLAILFALGYTKNSPEVKSLLLFFIHYLITKQLHDDAHDWENDIKKGHINAIGALLLQRYSSHSPNRPLVTVVPHLQKLFWYEVILDVNVIISKHIRLAKKVLHDCSPIIDKTPLEMMLKEFEDGMEMAIQERHKALAFLKKYHV